MTTAARSRGKTGHIRTPGGWARHVLVVVAAALTAGISGSPWARPSPALANVAGIYQGFGSTTRGGTGETIVHVTNLNDSGPGSFREAVSRGSRTVVFDVAGDIVLTDYVYVMGAFITVDGLTAPAPGITLRNRGLVIRGNRGAHDVIVRGIRIRNSPLDGIQIAYGAYNIVVDRVSVHGSGDGNLDITEGSHDVTVSWSVFAEPVGEGKNMLIKYNPSRITLHHNLFVGALQRNPQVRIDDAGTPATDTTVDMRNNLIWDWGIGYGTRVWYGPWVNIVNNFYSSPTSSLGDKNLALMVCTGNCNGGDPASLARAYVAGNFSADRLSVDINAAGNERTAFSAPPVDTADACTAAHEVLSGAGVRPLDQTDEQYLSAVTLPTCASGSATASVPPPSSPNGTGGTVVTAPQAVGAPTPPTIPVTPAVRAPAERTGTVQVRIAGKDDDASESGSGRVRTRETSLIIGSNYLLGLRFAAVPIPPGAIIDSVVLKLHGTAYTNRQVSIRYLGEAGDDSASFVMKTGNLSRRPLTRAFVDAAPTPWVRGGFNPSPDLAAIVQEIVSRPGWALGNSLTIFVADNGSPDAMRIGTFDRTNSPAEAAILEVIFRAP